MELLKFITTLKEKKYNRKYKKQRRKKGWCDEDLFSLDAWFQSTFVDMLNNFEMRLHGYPMEDFKEIDSFPKSWVKLKLDEIKQELKKNKYTFDYTDEEIDEMIEKKESFIKWKLILKRIAYCLEQTNEDKCIIKDKYYDLWWQNVWMDNEDPKIQEQLFKKSLEKTGEINTYREKCAKEAFQLLGKYFFSLWD